MKRRKVYFITIVISGIIAGSFYYFHNEQTQESIIFFPLDRSVLFTVADTTLTLINEKQNDEYFLEWDVTSILDRDVYLRQDISLLFAGGRLKATQSEWEDNSKKIAQIYKDSR